VGLSSHFLHLLWISANSRRLRKNLCDTPLPSRRNSIYPWPKAVGAVDRQSNSQVFFGRDGHWILRHVVSMWILAGNWILKGELSFFLVCLLALVLRSLHVILFLLILTVTLLDMGYHPVFTRGETDFESWKFLYSYEFEKQNSWTQVSLPAGTHFLALAKQWIRLGCPPLPQSSWFYLCHVHNLCSFVPSRCSQYLPQPGWNPILPSTDTTPTHLPSPASEPLP
jgi:hypothetical protein